MTMEMSEFDLIVINTSGGKDSQTMMGVVVDIASGYGIQDRLVAVHCDLGRMEWPGTTDLVRQQCAAYEVPLEIISRPQGDLLEHVLDRRMWPSSKQRYCTSDHKRGQANKVITRLANAMGKKHAKVLNCFGFRAEESPARAKRAEFSQNNRLSNNKREVWDWLPIHKMPLAEVWRRIRTSGVPYHRAYDLGMPRLSCAFCIFAPKSALVLAGKHNRTLLYEYLQVEREIGHKFRQDCSIEDVVTAVENNEPQQPVKSWNM